MGKKTVKSNELNNINNSVLRFTHVTTKVRV